MSSIGKPLGICLGLAALSYASLLAQNPAYTNNTDKPAIVSPSRPTDSLGETVYEVQGEKQKDVPVVLGKLLRPTPIKRPEPKYSRAMRKTKFSGEVSIEGVVTPTGDWIDLQPLGTPDADAEQAAMKAVSKYRFKPGTLDGKPVAELMRVEVFFKIFY
jgi:outer membrane biosynthesis protein TonB